MILEQGGREIPPLQAFHDDTMLLERFMQHGGLRSQQIIYIRAAAL